MESVQSVRKAGLSSRFLLFAILVLSIDQLTKFLAIQLIPPIDSIPYQYPYGGIGVFKNFLGIEFSIVHMTNKGAAWGVFGEHQHPLIALRLILITTLFIYFLFGRHERFMKISIAAVICGALGNVIDYFLYGHVVDMLHFVLWGYDFPVFNIADTAISLGIGSIMMISWTR